MNYLLRKFLLLLALSIAVTGTAMAKDDAKTTKSKLKSGLFSKKAGKTTTKKLDKKAKSKKGLFSKKTSKSKTTKKSTARTSSKKVSEGKAQFKNTTVNINKASASALSAMLVGIGPVKATEIVNYRKKNGKFKSLDDLMKVDGIGEETLKGIKKNVSLTRGEIKAPEGYKMGSATKKAGSKKTTSKKSSSMSSRKKSSSKADAKLSAKKGKMSDSSSTSKKTMKKKTGSLKLKKESGTTMKKKTTKKPSLKKKTVKKTTKLRKKKPSSKLKKSKK